MGVWGTFVPNLEEEVYERVVGKGIGAAVMGSKVGVRCWAQGSHYEGPISGPWFPLFVFLGGIGGLQALPEPLSLESVSELILWCPLFPAPETK